MAHIHILGICGTFMGGIAALARQLGHRVTGSDRNVYPPMSTQLEKLGIEISDDQDISQLTPAPDLVIIGNALSRGHPLAEEVLNRQIPYTSGPQWLGEAVLRNKHVLAISGTHGKTTTASMLTWILHQAGLQPGFLVGGVVQPFGETARLSESDYFVIEADEYDTAFFDKRSKFVHYFSDTFVINNLEYDHADIFSSLSDIQRQFAHALRTVPGSGQVIYPAHQKSVRGVIEQGCWSTRIEVGSGKEWAAKLDSEDGSAFTVMHKGKSVARVAWSLLGKHNVENGLMALIAANQVGVDLVQAARQLEAFESPARRLQLIAQQGQIHLYDDFAHHPTAIRTTLEAMRAKVGKNARIVAVFEPRTNTMKAGVHNTTLVQAFEQADSVYALQPEGSWQLSELLRDIPEPQADWIIETSVSGLAEQVLKNSEQTAEQHWVVMSNGGFGGIHQLLAEGLQSHTQRAV